MKRSFLPVMALAVTVTLSSCGGGKTAKKEELKPAPFTGAKGEVKIMTLDPGHFHAALVQKNMYDQVSSEVFVYAPEGNDLKEHLKRIEGYNTRTESPTAWYETIYTGSDYLEKMLSGKPGNVVVISGNNRIKTDYIKKSVEAGLNVLADKPMVITADKFPVLEEAFKIAREKGVLLYDIMTERFSVTTILQRELSMLPEVFGKLDSGTVEKPAVEKISVHYFYKNVSGKALVRPAWFFDVDQQGEGIVDVNTHLVDLVQWVCFPEQIIQKSDIQIIAGKRWPTVLSKDEFKEVTLMEQFPDYLAAAVKNDKLNVFANGEIVYKIKGVVAKVSAIWNYKAREGAGDTHYSIMRGSNSSLEIRQGVEEKYDPTLYIIAKYGTDLKTFAANLDKVVKALPQAGLAIESVNKSTWKIVIPAELKVGHEAHFAQVMAKYLEYLKDGKLPEWEVPNMITKYYTTTLGLKLAKETR
ncbi:MAG: oxidoreductase [Bacteroidia bacterium]|nr:oxidoreductase [Bacteroidia bacterium]